MSRVYSYHFCDNTVEMFKGFDSDVVGATYIVCVAYDDAREFWALDSPSDLPELERFLKLCLEGFPYTTTLYERTSHHE